MVIRALRFVSPLILTYKIQCTSITDALKLLVFKAIQVAVLAERTTIYAGQFYVAVVLCCPLLIFFQNICFQKVSFRNTIRVSNSMGPTFFQPDL